MVPMDGEQLQGKLWYTKFISILFRYIEFKEFLEVEVVIWQNFLKHIEGISDSLAKIGKSASSLQVKE